MTAYYNEHDKFAAAWLRELIADGLIAPGDVDERSIEDVAPSELAGFRQCHFFAGIGVWSLALRNAGWPDDREIWTGSCPCQPFSAAGKGGGFADERHLWPALHWLIGERRPSIVVGEQVSSDDGLAWIDLVLADLDQSGYACGALDTCAAGFGAPHIRQRLYWLGYADDARHEGLIGPGDMELRGGEGPLRPIAATGSHGGLADAKRTEWRPHVEHDEQARGREQASSGLGRAGDAGRMADTNERAGGQGCAQLRGRRDRSDADERSGPCGDDEPCGMADADAPGSSVERFDVREDGDAQPRRDADRRCDIERLAHAGCQREAPVTRLHGRARAEREGSGDRAGPANGYWRNADWLGCRDGKWRPVESEAQLMVADRAMGGTVARGSGARLHFPLSQKGEWRNRVGELRGAGNALNLGQAEGFIRAVMETTNA